MRKPWFGEEIDRLPEPAFLELLRVRNRNRICGPQDRLQRFLRSKELSQAIDFQLVERWIRAGRFLRQRKAHGNLSDVFTLNSLQRQHQRHEFCRRPANAESRHRTSHIREPEREGGIDAEIAAAATAHTPEQIRVIAFIGGDFSSVRQDGARGQQAIACQSRARRQKTPTAAKRQPRDADRKAAPGGHREVRTAKRVGQYFIVDPGLYMDNAVSCVDDGGLHCPHVDQQAVGHRVSGIIVPARSDCERRPIIPRPRDAALDIGVVRAHRDGLRKGFCKTRIVGQRRLNESCLTRKDQPAFQAAAQRAETVGVDKRGLGQAPHRRAYECPGSKKRTRA